MRNDLFFRERDLLGISFWKPAMTITEIGLPHYMVNTMTLGLFIMDTIYAYKGYGPGIGLTITYNPNPRHTGMFGRSRTFIYESVIETRSGSLIIKKGGGVYRTFTRDGSSGVPTAGAPVELRAPDGVSDRLLDYGSYLLFLENGSAVMVKYEPYPDGSHYRICAIIDHDGNTLVISYNPDNTISSVTDAPGRTTRFTYDARQLCSSLILPDGRQAVFTYDTQMNLVSSSDLAGIVTEYKYDSENFCTAITIGEEKILSSFEYVLDDMGRHLSAVRDPCGNVTRYEIASITPRHIRVIDPEGNITRYLSSSGRTEKVVDPLGRTAEVTYEGNNRRIIRDKGGKTSVSEYDARGSLISQTSPSGSTVRYTYDPYGNLLTETGPDGDCTRISYDQRQHVIQVTTPTGKTLTYSYNDKGQLITQTGLSGNTVTYQYDRFGNVSEVTGAGNNRIRFSFDNDGLRLASVTDARGCTTLYEYDGNDRIVRRIFPDNTSVTYKYGSLGKTAAIDPDGNTKIYKRNPVSGITERIDPSGNSARYTFNKNNLLSGITDPLGRSFSFTYNPAGFLDRITGPIGMSRKYEYDRNDRVIAVSDGTGRMIRYGYHPDGKLAEVLDLQQKSMRYQYDMGGSIRSILNCRGGEIVFKKESGPERDRNIKMYDSFPVAEYIADPAGNLVMIKDESGAKNLDYNNLGQLVKVRSGDGKTIGLSYDEMGNNVSISYPNGVIVQYSYDNRSRIVRAQWGKNSVVFSYDNSGNPIRLDRSNGTETLYSYDRNNRIIRIRHLNKGSPFIDLRYVRDNYGNIVQESGTHVIPADPSILYNTQAPSHAVFNMLDQLVSYDSDSYEYDSDGNLTSVHGTGSLAAAYDHENHLISLTKDGIRTTFGYDSQGMLSRIQKKGRTTNHVRLPSGSLLAESDGDGKVLRNYIHAGGQLLAFCDDTHQSSFYHFDKTGNTLAITGPSGDICAAYTYDAFGAVIAGTASAPENPFTYTGEYGVIDIGGNLFCMSYRFYDAVTGRFIQRDPIGIDGGFNLYQYVENNPVTGIDPMGTGKPAPVPGKGGNAPVKSPAPVKGGKPQMAQWERDVIKYRDKFEDFWKRDIYGPIARNQYVGRAWSMADNYVQENIFNPAGQTMINTTIRMATQNVRRGGPPRHLPENLPTCRQIQKGTLQDVERYLETLATAPEYLPSGHPLSKVPRAVNALRSLYNASQGNNWEASKNLAEVYDDLQSEITDQMKEQIEVWESEHKRFPLPK